MPVMAEASVALGAPKFWASPKVTMPPPAYGCVGVAVVADAAGGRTAPAPTTPASVVAAAAAVIARSRHHRRSEGPGTAPRPGEAPRRGVAAREGCAAAARRCTGNSSDAGRDT